MTIKVLVADDHEVVRRGLKQILDEAPDIVVAGEASTGQETLKAVREGDFAVIVLDIAMPELSGMDVLKQLGSLKPGLRILMLSMYPEEQYAVRSLKGGADGYITKNNVADELVAAIRKVAQGGKYITLTLAEKLAATLGSEYIAEPHEMLSDREYQVMRKFAAGKSVKEIAAELSLSVKTISTYRTRILEKLDLRSTAEIIRYALERNLSE